MSLRSRILVRMAAVLGIGLALLGLMVHLLLQTVLTREVDALLSARAATVVSDLRSGEGGQPPRIGDRPVGTGGTADEFSTPGLYVQLVGADGSILARSTN